MASRISDYLEHDRFHADLLNKLKYDPQTCSISGISDRDYPDVNSLGVQEISLLRHNAIPEELRDQLNRKSILNLYKIFLEMKSNVSMGLFPEISRIWMTIDSDLFLWNSETK